MRRLFLLALLRCAFGSIPSQAADGASTSQLGFGYCPPPVVPACIEADGVRTHRPEWESCSRDVLRFTQALGRYRACLTRESERAIGSGNAAIARFRCLSQGGTSCR